MMAASAWSRGTSPWEIRAGDVMVRAETGRCLLPCNPGKVLSIHPCPGFQVGVLTLPGTDCQAATSPLRFQQDGYRRTLQAK